MTQSLRAALYRHRSEWFAYLAATLENDDAPMSHKPSLEVLENWTGAAVDEDEAREALAYALEMYEIGDTPVIPAMMRAVLGYLENGRPA